jgi:hypothetical protein
MRADLESRQRQAVTIQHANSPGGTKFTKLAISPDKQQIALGEGLGAKIWRGENHSPRSLPL